MSDSKIELEVANKGRFEGIFSLLPIPESEIQEYGLEELVGLKETWMPVLGFSDTYTPYKYDLSRVADYDRWKDRLYPRSEKDSSHDSLSLIFASLKSPDDYFYFAKDFGALFGSQSHSLESLRAPSAPSISALYELLDMNEGKRAQKVTSFLKLNGVVDSVCSYESLSDWIIASRLLNLAFRLTYFCKHSFSYSSEQGFITVNEESEVPLFGLISLGDNWFSIPLRLNPTDGQSSDFRINDEGEYCSFLINQLTLKSESNNDKTEIRGTKIYTDDLGYLRMEIFLPSLKKVSEDTLRDAMRTICDYLFQLHKVYLQLSLHNGKYSYCFDSLLTFLWYDFSQVVTGSRKIGICKYCGKPFFTNNGGAAKKYCNATCRNNAKNQRDKRHRKKSS